MVGLAVRLAGVGVPLVAAGVMPAGDGAVVAAALLPDAASREGPPVSG
jgi:hypothetical protein